MEHRIGSRTPLKLPIDLWRGKRNAGQFVSRNVSHGGIFIDHCSNNLQPGDFVYLKFCTCFRGQPHEYRMKALVVHQSASGAGLMWAGSNAIFHQELEKIRADSKRLSA